MAEFTIHTLNAKTLTSLVAMCLILAALVIGVPYLLNKNAPLVTLKIPIVLVLASVGFVFWHLAALRAWMRTRSPSAAGCTGKRLRWIK